MSWAIIVAMMLAGLALALTAASHARRTMAHWPK
jgi:VIT1/CCC1 family predicted Fe2+/Mn2+ transporter